MSYSIIVRASTKEEAKTQIAEKVAAIVHQQPTHSVDQAAILANANAIIDLLPDDKDGYEISGSLSGYISGTWDNGQMTELTQASIGANIGWVRKTE